MNESFSQEVKQEIASVRGKRKCCRAAMLYGMIFGATDAGTEQIRVEADNPAAALPFIRLVREFADVGGRSDASLTNIGDAGLIAALLHAVGTSAGAPAPDPAVMRCRECGWAFLRGVFLVSGTVTAPRNACHAYHMEFLIRSKEKASDLLAFLTQLGVPPKLIRRGDHGGVYYKDSEAVVDILGHIGANRAAFRMLDVKIYRDLRNNVNRVANCETANIGKTVAAANEQMKAIQAILEAGRADELPEELRQTLDLRAAFPDATLSELAEKHQPPITKSGVNHRLKRLIAFSEKC